MEGIDQRAIGRFCHRIDGQVTAGEILFQRDIGRGMKSEAVVTVPAFAFGAGKRIFILGLRMQEDREILTNWTETLFKQGFRGGADNHVIVVGVGPAEQLITDGAADDEYLHCRR